MFAKSVLQTAEGGGVGSDALLRAGDYFLRGIELREVEAEEERAEGRGEQEVEEVRCYLCHDRCTSRSVLYD